jgi:anion-transporting  ArsA/GET3 family ATPase
MNSPARPSVKQLLSRPMLFVSGKGGVGKTSASQAIARAQARAGKKTLWIGFEDPTRPAGELKRKTKDLFELNCAAELAFEEYVGMKLRVPGLAHLFLRNPLVKFLAKAGPGIHELVLLGKLWYERRNYDCIVADMPSTGFGLAMFQSIENWSKLFKGGPLHKDAAAMLDTFADPKECGQLIVALPEEMPLRESLELEEFLLKLFPNNRPGFLLNRLFPTLEAEARLRNISSNPDDWSSPVAESIQDFAVRRSLLENHNLATWRNEGIQIESLAWQKVRPESELSEFDQVVSSLEKQISQRGWL